MQTLAIADLQRSGISVEEAERAGMFYVPDASSVYPDFRAGPAIVIPYFDTSGELMTFERDGAQLPFCRVRYLDPPVKTGFKKAKPIRYSQPEKSGLHAYFAPLRNDWKQIQDDVREPVLITEGEKKAVAGILAGVCPVIALGGVFNWALSGTGELLPELAAWKWAGRDVFIGFDSDAATNPNILAAEARLVDELQRKRGARCYLVRMPQEGTAKVGLDDFLLAHGPSALFELIKSAPSLGALDAKVVALNQSVAWIEREGLIYDHKRHLFIPKDHFVKGSDYSSIKHITPGGRERSSPKEVSVAATWLTHPHAKRFSEVLFRPGEGPTVEGDHGRSALNLWTGWEPEHGDVQPFLDLSAYLFGTMRAEDRDLPLKLMAYKAQNPAVKVPLALVLIGLQGCGKTLWAECIRDAFSPYGVDVTSNAFYSEFQGWLERSLVAIINEAEREDMMRGGDVLKSLISDLRRPMNEKYRPAREVNAYASYIITSNKRAVGAFSADDRRMIVIDCPPKKEPAFYFDYIKPWKEAGGPKKLLGWLLDYDLKGWTPPATAPMSAEKYLAYTESLSGVQRLAEDMRTASADTLQLWLDGATAWADNAITSSNPVTVASARATLENAATIQVRPWYTPEELCLLFPAVVEQTMGNKFDKSTPPGRISRELREAGVPYLQNADDPRGFRWQGRIRQFLVVCNFDDWRRPLKQVEFDRLIAHFPTYGQLRRQRKKGLRQ